MTPDAAALSFHLQARALWERLTTDQQRVLAVEAAAIQALEGDREWPDGTVAELLRRIKGGIHGGLANYANALLRQERARERARSRRADYSG